MKVIDTDLFIHTISDIHKNDDHRKFCFVLGAGASYTSGIKTGNDLAEDWYAQIKSVYEHKPSIFNDWIKEQKIDIDKLGVSYGSIYRKRFENDKHSGYDSLANAMKDARASYGYIILAQILTKSSGHCIVTTNFDNLIEASIFQYTTKAPLVCGHESLSAYARPNQAHPLIVKIHRDLLLSPKSDPDEISKLDPSWQAPLDAIFNTHIPIVIGYGGNDEGLMSYFENMKTPSNFFWCDLNVENLAPRVASLIEKHDGKFVDIAGFDELMHEFGHAFDEINLLDKTFEDITKERTTNILQQKARISEKKEALKHEQLQKSDNNIPILEKGFSALEYGDFIDKETNLDKKKNLYEVAIKKYPITGWLWWSYSHFLHFIAKDFTKLDVVYENALLYNQNESGILGNYAVYSNEIKNDDEQAEKYFKKAIEAEKPDFYSLNNYGNFLRFKRKDFEGAAYHFKKAIELNIKDVSAYISYANLLSEQFNDFDNAETLYLKALGVDPKNAIAMTSYAYFLENYRLNFDKAESYYLDSISIDPSDGYSYLAYANFLSFCRKNISKAEINFENAFSLLKNSAELFTAYATFLYYRKKDNATAEVYFDQSLLLDPNNTNTNINYAIFISTVKKDYNKAKIYFQKALKIETTNPKYNRFYAEHLLVQGLKSDAKKPLEIALKSKIEDYNLIESWFLEYAYNFLNLTEAANKIEALLEKKVRGNNWDFVEVIDQAIKEGHPNPDKLKDFAKRISTK
jgi:Tfp pilus assembly protein PilF